MSGQVPGIVCLSHLGWNHVWQRPQQILSRLAQTYPVLYVAEPEIVEQRVPEPHLRLATDDGQLRAWQPAFPDRPEVIGRWRETYARLVQDLLLQEGWLQSDGDQLTASRPLIAWFYTPTPWYLLDWLPADVVVYDVMDELGNFKGAGTDLSWRESQLLAHCDLVFAGGRSLYAARRHRHPCVHLFPSGVDASHFVRALHPSTVVPPEIADLPHPVLGYYGVIDERLDLELLRALADHRRDWSIVLIGPVAKLEPADLPRAANLHYLGQQPYDRLPDFLAGFDLCLMPFALNEATRSISPTKALEYMAAGKPIVSTPVPDVVTNWSETVTIRTGACAFEEAIEALLAESEVQQAERTFNQERAVANRSWDSIAEEMRELVDGAMLQHLTGEREPRPIRFPVQRYPGNLRYGS